MTRILYWNIEKFGINKIDDPQGWGHELHTSITPAAASADRLQYIASHLLNTLPPTAPSRPDIIVVVEVVSGQDGSGYLVRGSGNDGSRELLWQIRHATNNAGWSLVPPLQTGGREAVAVYYDSTNYAFAGPYLWPGGNGASFAPGGGVSADYSGTAFAAALPHRQIPGGAPNAGLWEDEVAAQTRGFTGAAADPFLAGALLNFGTLRTPYKVAFAEIATGRQLSLFAIHAPANMAAAQYLVDLGRIAEIADPIAVNEVRVVLGDFNVNLLYNNITMDQNAAYNNIINAGYALGISRPGNPPNPLDGYQGYFATHMQPFWTATYWSAALHTDYYPGFGYTGAFLVPNFYSIDNILARYGAGLAAPNANVTVLNGVVGSNYAVINPPPGNPPIGHYRLPIMMRNPMFGAPAPVEPPIPHHQPQRITAFRNWDNFLRIRSTSDHMAIVADV
jgi:hypothetical protein